MILLAFALSLALGPCLAYKPVVLVHGIMTGSGSMEMIQHRIEEKHPGTVIYNVNRFESWSSLETMWHQVLEIGMDVANISAQHPEGINLLGYSQGGLIARGIVQTFPNVSVSTFISLSSPQAGQYGAGFLHLVFPGLVTDTVWQLFYSRVGQHTSVGNYWNDPYHQSLYEEYSVYLPYINNHVPSNKSEEFKKNFLRLKRLVLIGGPDDNVITPWQSSQFGYYGFNDTVVEMKGQDIYTEDRIGLKTLDDSGRLHVLTVPGVNHFSWHMNEISFLCQSKAAEGNFCQSSLPSLHKPDGSLAHTAKEKADLLGSLFASNSILHVGDTMPPSISQCSSSMPEVHFTQKAVRKELLSLNVRKSSGPDSIPAIVLKQCAPELCSVLSHLFNLSYTTGVVPSSWKVAHVHPIPKKGDRTDPSNYRPIAITSLLCKVMERVINTRLLGYLEEHQLISDRQYGFRHGRSAGDLLVYLTHSWAEAIESRGEALAVSLDIAKAFDRVWHRALLSKLPSYGLPEGLCNWIASFLSGRCIKSVVDGSCSDSMPINAGVPQGSVLSPTLSSFTSMICYKLAVSIVMRMTARVIPSTLAVQTPFVPTWM